MMVPQTLSSLIKLIKVIIIINWLANSLTDINAELLDDYGPVKKNYEWHGHVGTSTPACRH